MEHDEFEDLKQSWAAQFAGVEQRVAALEQQLAGGARRRVRSALWPSALWTAIEGAFSVAAAVVLANVLARHVDDARYLVCGGASIVVLLGVAGFAVVRVGRSLRLDLAQPVVAIQRDVARLRRTEVAALAWALLGGIVVWLPVALLLFEAVTATPVLSRVDLPWLTANLGFGVLLAVVAVVGARRIAASARLRPWLARAADALSGRGLRRASAQLTELEQFAGGQP